MNIRLRFKLIALLIVLSLAGLLVFQGYWLKGLYDTLYKQMEINIEEAMKIADYKELFLRIRAIKKEQGALGPQTQDVYFSSELDPSNKLKMTQKLRSIRRKKILTLTGKISSRRQIPTHT